MRQFLKKIFGKQSTPELTLTSEQLGRWITKQHGAATKQLAEQLQKKAIEAQHWIAETTHALNNLQNAELTNQAIPEQHKSIASGNKEAFIKNVTNYLDQFRLPDQVNELASWFEVYELATQVFLENTSRQSAVLQEFHAREKNAVLESLRRIEQLTNQLRKELEESKHAVYVTAHHSFTQCIDKENFCKEIQQNIAALHASLQTYASEQTRLTQEQQRIAKDSARIMLEQELITTQQTVKQLEDKLRNMVAPLEAGLRKYAKLAPLHAHVIEQYLASPSDALSQDVHLKITEVLVELQKNAWNDTLELKQDKKTRTINAIANLNKPFLQKLITTYAKLKRDEVRLAQALISHKTSQELNMLRKETEAVHEIMKKKQLELADLQKKQDTNTPDYTAIFQLIQEQTGTVIRLK